ncbi:unnamed protein product [Rotaria sp. Silwood2]|nr:unnamed protein product [Rotaria sp. Silwood2]CAF3993094.1 unnamed protein product [Rotaria sp. Silwood2]
MVDVSILDSSGNQLIVNDEFEGGAYGTANDHPTAYNWISSGSSFGCCMSVVTSTFKSGTHSWEDGCVGTTDNLSQSFSTNVDMRASLIGD